MKKYVYINYILHKGDGGIGTVRMGFFGEPFQRGINAP